jgi:hypothetical protein
MLARSIAFHRKVRPLPKTCGLRPTGVTELWIVDPKNFEVRVFHLRKDPDAPMRLLRFGDVLTSDLLPGLHYPSSGFFGLGSSAGRPRRLTLSRCLACRSGVSPGSARTHPVANQAMDPK